MMPDIFIYYIINTHNGSTFFPVLQRVSSRALAPKVSSVSDFKVHVLDHCTCDMQGVLGTTSKPVKDHQGRLPIRQNWVYKLVEHGRVPS